MNTLVVGMTQSGKSTAELRRIVECKKPVVLLDPHGTLARKYMEWLGCKGKTAAFDDLSRVDHVLQWDFLKPSTSDNDIIRTKENEDSARNFADILCRRRDIDISKTPLIEEWTMLALRLYLEQTARKHLTELLFAFQPREQPEQYRLLIKDCSVDYIARRFMNLRRLAPSTLRGEVGPALRLFEGTLGSVPFAIRCSPNGFDYASHLEQGKSIVIAGDRENKNTTSLIMSAIIQLVIQYVRSGGVPVRIVVDEANNYRLIGRPEIESLAEDQKIGIDWSILTQSMTFPQEDYITSVLDNCGRHEWFRCSGPTAKIAAEDVGVTQIKPDAVKATEVRTRQVHDGYKYEETKSRNVRKRSGEKIDEGETTGEQARAVYREVHDEIKIYENYDEQIMRWQQKIMALRTGHRVVREGERVWEEYVKPVKAHPWDNVAKKKGEAAIQLSIGEHGTITSLPSSTNTPSRLPSPSSSESSLPTKRRGNDSTGSSGGKGVDPFA